MHVGSGDDKKIWHLPEKLLKSNSTFFTAALEGGFAEGISKNITLPDEDPDIFKCFVEWLYVGDQIAALGSVFLVWLWNLGDRLGCPLMQDDAICNIVLNYCNAHIEEITLKFIYEGSAPGSKLRRFAVDQCLLHVRQPREAWHNYEGCSYVHFVNDNEDFAQQLAEATILLGNEKPKDPFDDPSPYLYAPSPAKSKTRSGS